MTLVCLTHRNFIGTTTLTFPFGTTRTMVLGRKPFKGLQLLPTTSGRHVLKAHIAYKGFTDDSELSRRLLFSATVRGADGNDIVYWSSLHGRWIDDSASEWINDENLTQYLCTTQSI